MRCDTCDSPMLFSPSYFMEAHFVSGNFHISVCSYIFFFVKFSTLLEIRFRPLRIINMCERRFRNCSAARFPRLLFLLVIVHYLIRTSAIGHVQFSAKFARNSFACMNSFSPVTTTLNNCQTVRFPYNGSASRRKRKQTKTRRLRHCKQ